jgi:chromate transporter
MQRTLGRDYLLWGLFAILAVTTVWTKTEIVWLFILSGLIALFVNAPPKSQAIRAKATTLSPGVLGGLAGAASLGTVSSVFVFFLKAGAFVFGSGLAIVPFLYGGVVGQYHWLTERQFLDAVAVAMITPGPIVITSGFIGFLVAGPLGACAAALAVFLPPYLLVIFGAPHYRRFAKNRQVKCKESRPPRLAQLRGQRSSSASALWWTRQPSRSQPSRSCFYLDLGRFLSRS